DRRTATRTARRSTRSMASTATVRTGSTTEDGSVEKTDRIKVSRWWCKAREITVMISRCVKARTRQRQDGQRLAEGEGCEDKACKTSDPAHGRDSGCGAKTRLLPDDFE
ncbi:hypothetical protein CF319_g9510, partial [Tilletia indica]